MKLSVVITHYFDERRSNAADIIASVHTGNVWPDEIIIWDNGPTPLELIRYRAPEIVHVRSSRNVGSQARVLAGLMARGERVLFLDNDTRLCRFTISNLLSWSDALGRSVVTLEGRQAQGGHYSRWPKVYGRGLKNAQKVFLSLGRGELVHRSVLNEAAAHFPFGPSSEMDDMLLSQAYARIGADVVVVPCRAGRSDLEDISMGGVGACKTPNWNEKRDLVARTLTIPCDEDSLRAQAESA